ERLLTYDRWPRSSLLDHLWREGTSRDQVQKGHGDEIAGFIGQPFAFEVKRESDLVHCRMERTTDVAGQKVKLVKDVALRSGEARLRVSYRFEGLSASAPFV